MAQTKQMLSFASIYVRLYTPKKMVQSIIALHHCTIFLTTFISQECG